MGIVHRVMGSHTLKASYLESRKLVIAGKAGHFFQLPGQFSEQCPSNSSLDSLSFPCNKRHKELLSRCS